MKKYLYINGWAWMLLVALTLASCSEIEYKYPLESMSNGKEISNFELTELGLKGTKINDSTIVIITLRTYDTAPLKNIVPSFKTSIGSAITPSPELAQNFLEPVNYYITSERGETKKWTIYHKFRDFTQSGIGEIDSLWHKTSEELGLAKNTENTIAVLGDKLIFSRTGVMVDKLTGEPTGEKLNFNGIDAGKGNAAQNIPFCLTNDDAGNMLGCTLGAWSTPYFRVYQWDKPDQSPRLVVDHMAAEEAIGGTDGKTKVISQYGRKLIAQGDINKEGVIGSFNYSTNGFHSYHDFWEISSGTFNGNTQRIGTGFIGTNFYQKAFLKQTNAAYPYFYSDANVDRTTKQPITVLKYVWKEGDEKKELAIKGPLMGHRDDVGEGWGRGIMDSKLFKFYGKEYLALLYSTNRSYYVTILDPGEHPQNQESYKSVLYFEHPVEFVISGPQGNGNATTSIAVSERLDSDGVTRMTFYAFMTNTGVICFEFNNYGPEF